MTNRKPWDHGGKTRHQQGYGRQHELIRAEMMQTIILCQACQAKDPPRVTVGIVADHIVPLSKGGSGERDNYQLLCPECHDEKTIREKGHKPRRKRRFGLDGWPIEE
jgi:5-methylcytosine-specific restriction protein A